jgi:putative DNA primase/helicase
MTWPDCGAGFPSKRGFVMGNEAGHWEPPQLRDIRAEFQANPALAAQVLAESGTAQRSLRAVKAGDFLRMEIKPREMLLEPILPVQGLAMIHAKRGVGKTHIALGIAVAVASGKDFLRWKAPKPRKVLFVDGELPGSVLQEWVAKTVAAVGADEVGDNLTIITPDLQQFSIPDLATLEGQAALLKHVEAADLVILDNLSALVRAGNENDAESWLPIQAWALDLRRRGKSLFFVHHSGRSGNPRGTSKREDLLDTVITLRHSPSYRADEGLRAELHFEKNRHFHGKDAEPFEVELQAGTDGVPQWLTRDLEASGYEKAAALFAEGCDALAVKEELGLSRATAFRYQKQYRESQSHVSAPRV